MAQDLFKETLKIYLDNRAQTDPLFAQSYAKPNKNLNDCASYVINRAEKDGRAGIAQVEVFGWAAHYYDEDEIKVGTPRNCKIIVATDTTVSTPRATAPNGGTPAQRATKPQIESAQTSLF